MPSLKVALDLLLNDRRVFSRRLAGFLRRSCERPLARLLGRDFVYDDVLLLPSAKNGDKRILAVFSCNPFMPSGIATSLLAQCRLFAMHGFKVDAVWHMRDEIDRSSRTAFIDYFGAKALIFPANIHPPLEKDGVTAKNIDDWLDDRLLAACSRMLANYDYAAVVAHQPWLSGVLRLAPPAARKVLFMHDDFALRAERFEKQGLKRRDAFFSISGEEQAKALNRADTVLAVTDVEREAFSGLVSEKVKVFTAKIPLVDNTRQKRPANKRLVAGIMASANYNNRVAVADFVRRWENERALCQNARLIIAGNICSFVNTSERSVIMLGRVASPDSFYCKLDVAVNPDCGGTGIKLKSLEALSFGVPLVCSQAGSAGLDTASSWHRLEGRGEMILALKRLLANRSELEIMGATSRNLFYAYNNMQGYLEAMVG